MFKIDSVKIVEPVQLAMQRESNVFSVIETQSGRRIADIRGWRFSNTTLQWGTIPEEQLLFLIKKEKFKMTFDDIDGERTVKAVRIGFSGQKQRFLVGGKVFYANFGMEVMFPDVYDF